VRVHQPGAVRLKVHESVADVRFSFTQGLNFRAVKDQTGFQLFEQVIVIGSRAILRDDLLLGLFGLFRWFGH
jgi:hypothetical protein